MLPPYMHQQQIIPQQCHRYATYSQLAHVHISDSYIYKLLILRQASQYTVSSAEICICTIHLATIFFLYHQWPHMYSLFGKHTLFSVFMSIALETVHMWIMPMKCWQSQIFYICKPCFFFHICDTFSIPCLAFIFVSENAFAVFTVNS